MSDETDLQHIDRAQPDKGGIQRFRAAIDAWFERKAAYDADPNTFEKAVDRRKRKKKREVWRLEYAVRVGRDVRDYERDQTPERRAEKKAAKSKEERKRRLASSTPEKIAADREAAKVRAKKSRDAAKQQKADAERAEDAARRNDPAFGRF